MKTLTLIIAFVLSVTFTNAQEAKTGQTITVNIDKLQSEAGHILVSLHTENTFMKGNGIKDAKSKIVDGKVTVTFENIAAGTYAILVLHDINDNNQMDFEPNGMPKESFGALQFQILNYIKSDLKYRSLFAINQLYVKLLLA